MSRCSAQVCYLKRQTSVRSTNDILPFFQYNQVLHLDQHICSSSILHSIVISLFKSIFYPTLVPHPIFCPGQYCAQFLCSQGFGRCSSLGLQSSHTFGYCSFAYNQICGSCKVSTLEPFTALKPVSLALPRLLAGTWPFSILIFVGFIQSHLSSRNTV